MTLGVHTSMTRKKQSGDINRNRDGRMMNAMGRQGEKEGDIGCQCF